VTSLLHQQDLTIFRAREPHIPSPKMMCSSYRNYRNKSPKESIISITNHHRNRARHSRSLLLNPGGLIHPSIHNENRRLYDHLPIKPVVAPRNCMY
jgi:hypothetical protein